MPHIVIDGQRIEARDGKTVIEAAYDNGMQMPHFCWHPELSVSGNCRMCLVEVGLPKRLPDGDFDTNPDGTPVVNFFPKLQIACATTVADGMHILTNTEKAITAREAVMEFILINHPLDCPICDEAGQCKLQEYSFRHSNGESRFDEEKNHNLKRQKWGPNVIYDGERCISCSRCIRFAKEVAHQDVLTFIHRGDHVTIKLFDGTEFDNDYSMNVIDICPVGALTSPDFRFKARVWDMSFNDTICTGCARGCNISAGVRDNEILRFEPRTNMYVNKHWMCDYGRLNIYPDVNSNRVESPMVIEKGERRNTDWDEACEYASYNLKKYRSNEIMVIGSPNAANEDNYILQKFAKTVLRTHNIGFLKAEDDSFTDDFLKLSDIRANSLGANEVGVNTNVHGIRISDLADKINNGHLKALYVMEEDFLMYPHILEALGQLEFLAVHAVNNSKLTELAHVVFPTSSFAESEGTFVNAGRRVQYFSPVLATKENLRTMGMKMSRLDKFGTDNDRWTSDNYRNARQSWRVIQAVANCIEHNWSYKSSSDIFDEISNTIATFKGMSYSLLKQYQGIILSRADKPEPKLAVYQSYSMKPGLQVIRNLGN